MAQDTLQQCQEALDLSFESAKLQFDKHHIQPPFQPGDTVFVETNQQNLLYKKFADQFKGPYKVLELLNNNILKLVPLDNGPPISTHVNNWKPGLLRPIHLEANDMATTHSQTYIRPVPVFSAC